MRSRQAALWLLVCLGGLALMVFSYGRYQRVAEPTAWTRAVMYVVEEEPAEPAEEANRPEGRRVLARFLPLSEASATLARAVCGSRPEAERAFLRNRQEKVILFPGFAAEFTQEMLASGRLPRPGRGEVLAGHGAARRDAVTVAGERFAVVGVLRRSESLFSHAYLVPDDAAGREIFDVRSKSVKQAIILTTAEVKQFKDRLRSLFPRRQFTPVVGLLRPGRVAYYMYLAGMLFLLGGGSALLVGGFVSWSGKVSNRWIGPALEEIRRRRRLLYLLHGIYFGLCLVSMLLIYEAPMVQDALLATVQGEVESESGVLGTAGQAYRSQNMALAAVVTLAINFLFGSFAMITLPSAVLPGIGVLIALWRALMWGIILAPTHVALSGSMLPHSLTLLLEGEAYILAAFFALLIPIYLCRREPGTGLASRYGRAILINLKGNLLVLLVLAVAATYEAIEVILQMKG